MFCFSFLVDGIASNWVCKAALNMATTNLSSELQQEKMNMVCISLHMGTMNDGV